MLNYIRICLLVFSNARLEFKFHQDLQYDISIISMCTEKWLLHFPHRQTAYLVQRVANRCEYAMLYSKSSPLMVWFWCGYTFTRGPGTYRDLPNHQRPAPSRGGWRSRPSCGCIRSRMNERPTIAGDFLWTGLPSHRSPASDVRQVDSLKQRIDTICSLNTRCC